MSGPRAYVVALIVAGVLATSVAYGQEEEAARQFDLGQKAFKAKKYVQAALAFEAAGALRPHPLTLYSAALAWKEADRPDRAADDFGRAVKLEGLSAGDAARAKEELDSLERTLGTVVVTAPAGWTVQFEGSIPLATPARVHGSTGAHTLLVVAPGKGVVRRDVTLENGRPISLELKDEAPVPTTVPVTNVVAAPPKIVVVELERPGEMRRTIGFGVLGLGVATVAAGVVLGLRTLDARDAYIAGPTAELESHVHSLETWTNVALIAGAAITIGGGVLAFWPSPPQAKTREVDKVSVRVAPTLGGAVLDGRF